MDGTDARECKRQAFHQHVTGFFQLVPPVAVVVAAVAGLAAWLGFSQAGNEAKGVWWEVGKAGLGVLAVAVVGGATAAAFRQRERDREREIRKDDDRAEFVGELWDAYHKAKAVRRELTGAGIKKRLADGGRDFDDKELRKALAEQMGDLNDAQLIIEKLIRTVRREQREVFTRSRYPYLNYGPRLLSLLTRAESYARNVLHDWEDQFPPDGENHGRMLGFLGDADELLGLNRMTVALERAADIVYSLRSENRRGHVVSAERQRDCDLWNDDQGVGKEAKSERIKKPPECA